MPTGEVYKKDGPQAQERLGQILCTDGDIIPFFNTEDLDVGEPVIFDIIRTKLKVKVNINDETYDYLGMIPVGILPKGFGVDSRNPKKKWPAELQERWKKEWMEFKSDEEIKGKLRGKLRTSVKNHPHCD